MNYNAGGEGKTKDTYCTGGLKARIDVQGGGAETPVVPHRSPGGVSFEMLASAPAGTVMTTEAWCYGEDDAEVAYARVTRSYTDTFDAQVLVLAPSPFRKWTLRDGCLALTQRRGPLICFSAPIYE